MCHRQAPERLLPARLFRVICSLDVPPCCLPPLMEGRVSERTTPGPLLAPVFVIGHDSHAPRMREYPFEKEIEPARLFCFRQKTILAASCEAAQDRRSVLVVFTNARIEESRIVRTPALQFGYNLRGQFRIHGE